MNFKTWYKDKRELIIEELITIYIPGAATMMGESYERKIDYAEDLDMLKLYCKALELFSTNNLKLIKQGYNLTAQKITNDDPLAFRVEIISNLKAIL
ncbi:MAG: hypothetical protein PUJ82_00640 [Spirochaetales bacterium]|nr:hypothetical protein [Spirochaetales bacterium]MDY5914558.1 hypothetical protein [Treponema sp.]